jgi:hypothetical protein
VEWIAPAVAVVTLVVLVADKLFGGGRSLAREFAKLEKHMVDSIAAVRQEMQEKREMAIVQTGDAMTGMRTQMHQQENKHLEFRAMVAETYMRRDSYYKASEELKGEMNRGFEKLDKRLERIEQNGHDQHNR